MENPVIHGKPPYKVVLVHGGPGAQGEMAPVAGILSENFGIIEALQTRDSIDGQVQELRAIISGNADPPVTVAGFSWGAWLGTIFSALYPEMVRKLVLISSGPFHPKYSRTLLENRLSRLSWEEQEEVLDILDLLDTPDFPDKDGLLCRFGQLMKKADSFNLIPHKGTPLQCSFEIFRKIWCEATELRSSGKLLEMAGKLNCPVVAIHGDYDPTPVEGIKETLSPLIRDFHFYLLEKCGHYPWYESYARDRFFTLIEKILRE